MKNEFVPYEQALALKELGFDDPCLGLWNLNNGKYEVDIIGVCKYSKELKYREVLAPLYQQAFRWLREKYDIHYSIDRECSQQDHKWGYNWSLYNYTGIFNEYLTSHPDAPAGEWVYDTYEEAELACLDKLIEIVATKQREQ